MTKDECFDTRLEDICSKLLAIAPEKEIQKRIEKKLDRCGIMYRIFSRIKEKKSLQMKLESKWEKYKMNNTKLQDIMGIRIVLYFKDDIDICIKILKQLFVVDNCEHDKPDTETFKPQRINYVFRIPEDIWQLSEETSKECQIDNTFEVQVRTIFSEGWHEVEHDVRYKYREDWNNAEILSRELNGILAVLEVCDNNILSICDNMAYQKYKQKEWEAMLRNKFRLRLQHVQLNDKIKKFLNENPDVGKEVYRCERNEIINFLCNNRVPLTCDNIIYILNELVIHDQRLHEMTPELIRQKCEKIASKDKD